MLTGDKVETAVNIGVATSLLDPSGIQFIYKWDSLLEEPPKGSIFRASLATLPDAPQNDENISSSSNHQTDDDKKPSTFDSQPADQKPESTTGLQTSIRDDNGSVSASQPPSKESVLLAR